MFRKIQLNLEFLNYFGSKLFEFFQFTRTKETKLGNSKNNKKNNKEIIKTQTLLQNAKAT